MCGRPLCTGCRLVDGDCQDDCRHNYWNVSLHVPILNILNINARYVTHQPPISQSSMLRTLCASASLGSLALVKGGWVGPSTLQVCSRTFLVKRLYPLQAEEPRSLQYMAAPLSQVLTHDD